MVKTALETAAGVRGILESNAPLFIRAVNSVASTTGQRLSLPPALGTLSPTCSYTPSFLVAGAPPWANLVSILEEEERRHPELLVATVTLINKVGWEPGGNLGHLGRSVSCPLIRISFSLALLSPPRLWEPSRTRTPSTTWTDALEQQGMEAPGPKPRCCKAGTDVDPASPTCTLRGLGHQGRREEGRLKGRKERGRHYPGPHPSTWASATPFWAQSPARTPCGWRMETLKKPSQVGGAPPAENLPQREGKRSRRLLEVRSRSLGKNKLLGAWGGVISQE